MWTVCITSVSHVLKVNGYRERQVKVNEKSQCFKGWETLVNIFPFEVKGKERRAQLAEAGTLSATKTNSLGQISFKAKKYRQSSYYIVIENLKPGEYGISLGDPDKRNEKNDMKITTFSVK